MAQMFLNKSPLNAINSEHLLYDTDADLKKHSWHPMMSALDAEDALSGKSIFTYLIRPCDYDRGFMISFVNANGDVAHDHFTLIYPKFGIWRNSVGSNVGSLHSVLRMMMHCKPEEGQPLN